MFSRKTERILTTILILAHLVPLWQSKYFLTGDGPCHLYNSRILLDHVKDADTEFYANFYALNSSPDPNWFTHISLAALLFVFPPWLAEKLFLTAFALLFLFGAKKLVQLLQPE